MTERLPRGFCQRHFAGVTEGGMPQIMAHGNRLRQVLVEIQCLGNGSGNTADFNGMGHTGAVMVTFRTQKHLRFMHQTAECLGMNDLIGIPLKNCSHILNAGLFRVESAPGFIRKGRSGIQMLMLLPLQFFL